MQRQDSLRKPHESGTPKQPETKTARDSQKGVGPAVLPVDTGKQHASTAKHSGQASEYWPPSPEWSLVWVTLLLVAVTTGLAIYTSRLWRATKKLAGDAAETAKTAREDSERIRVVMLAQQTAMQDQALAARAMVDAANAQKATMDKQEARMAETLEAMGRQEELIGRQLATMEGQGQAMRDSVKESVRSADAMEAQVARSTEMAQRQLRAYIVHERLITADATGKPVKVPPQVPPETTSYALVFRNAGKTPAYDVEVAVDQIVLPIDFDKFPPMGPGLRWSRASVGPRCSVSIFVSSIELSEPTRQAILAGTHQAFVWAQATYKDAFGVQRYTRVKYRRDVKGQAMLAYRDGNDAD